MLMNETTNQFSTGDKVQRRIAVGPAYSVGVVKHVMPGTTNALVSFEGTWPVWMDFSEIVHHQEA